RGRTGTPYRDDLERIAQEVVNPERAIRLGVRADFVRTEGHRISPVGQIDVDHGRRQNVSGGVRSIIGTPSGPLPLPFATHARAGHRSVGQDPGEVLLYLHEGVRANRETAPVLNREPITPLVANGLAPPSDVLLRGRPEAELPSLPVAFEPDRSLGAL